MSKRKLVIITFKPKDQRLDQQTDKLQIVRSVMAKGTRAHFFDAAALAMGSGQPATEEHVIGYDVNRYEAPIVSAQLTESEIQALRRNGNVAKVEDDTPCYAAGYGPLPALAVLRAVACSDRNHPGWRETGESACGMEHFKGQGEFGSPSRGGGGGPPPPPPPPPGRMPRALISIIRT